MILFPSEAALFFKLMLPLQFFVNSRLGVLPKINTFEKYCNAPTQKKFEVRTALFENAGLIDDFIDDNPHDIPMKELNFVSKWKKFIKGEFYIERYLKNAAIFISDDEKVYSVLGLTQSVSEYFPKYSLPVRLDSVILLPFQDKIITDGFFVPYPVSFGSGIKGELKEIYAEAKQKDKLIKNF